MNDIPRKEVFKNFWINRGNGRVLISGQPFDRFIATRFFSFSKRNDLGTARLPSRKKITDIRCALSDYIEDDSTLVSMVNLMGDSYYIYVYPDSSGRDQITLISTDNETFLHEKIMTSTERYLLMTYKEEI